MNQESTSTGKSKRKRRLGRGLTSLMGSNITNDPQPVEVVASKDQVQTPGLGMRSSSNKPDSPVIDSSGNLSSEASAGGISYLSINSIRPNRYQPRTSVDEHSIRELADSIRAAGVMQPIIVRPCGDPGRESGAFELIAGERRWRAARLAGLTSIPSMVRDASEEESAQWALIENLQREDLDPIEKAEAFQRLVDEFDLTQSQVAEKVSLDRSSVANILRLNTLDEATKADIQSGRLSQGHAKALLSIPDPKARRAMAQATMLGKWSVRELEQKVSQDPADSGAPGNRRERSSDGSSPAGKPSHILDLEQELSQRLDSVVTIKLGRQRSSGKVMIAFESVSEFEKLADRLRKTNPDK